MSGVTPTDGAVKAYNDLKLGKKARFLIYGFSSDWKHIELLTTGARDATWADMTADLPEDNCQYIIYDFDYKTADGSDRSKLLFILWAPDTAKIKAKLLVASSKEAFKKKLVGIGMEIQACDQSDIDEEEIMKRLIK